MYFDKKLNFLLIAFIFFLFSASAYCQSKVTISGTIRDVKNGEVMIGASLLVKELPTEGAVTNSYGFYSLSLLKGKYTFRFFYTGYDAKDTIIDLRQNIKLDVELQEGITTLKEVTVTSQAANKNVTSPQMSSQNIDIKEIADIPVFFGEKDVMKTIQLLPGIKAVTEGNTGFYVRGGGADQNLILLDGANVYNPGHLLGFFSVFNSDAIKDITVYTGGIPAEYGGRISSVLDIAINDGDNKEFKVSGGIGLIDSRLNLEGPIKKNKGSFIISGRRTYADLFLKLFGPPMYRNTSLYFYDLNLKANYQLGPKDRIYLSGYFGRDNFSFDNTSNSANNFGINWGNATATLRWNHLFNDQLFLNSSLVFSNYSNNIVLGAGDAQFQITNGIRDFSLKEAFEYYINSKNTLKFGLESIYHTFIPGEVTVNTASDSIRPQVLGRTIQQKYALESGIYISDDVKLSKKISFMAGLRYSIYTELGPGLVYTYDANGNIIDSTNYSSLKPIVTYMGLEPRASVVYQLNDVSSLKASYNHIDQYIDLLSNSTTETPVDLWVSSSPVIKPQIGDQEAVGYFRNFKDNMYESSVEVYYKNMQNQIDYKPGADLVFNNTVESQLLFGRGWAYGAEFFVKKKYGKFHGWISYTWSRSIRQFPGIDNDVPFPAKQDIIDDLAVVGIYELSKKVTLSATFVYYTGNAVTFPSGKYEIDGQVVNLYTERNGYRMPPYNRLDVALTWIRKKTKKVETSWNFSIYNLYDRENAFAIFFQPNPNDPSESEAVQLSLFRIVPSVTYNFKF
jgi:hypothetical protein